MDQGTDDLRPLNDIAVFSNEHACAACVDTEMLELVIAHMSFDHIDAGYSHLMKDVGEYFLVYAMAGLRPSWTSHIAFGG